MKHFTGLLICCLLMCPGAAQGQTNVVISRGENSRWTDSSFVVNSLRVTVWTNHEKYSLNDSLDLAVTIQNLSSEAVFIDRRMYWSGYGGGLKLVISDENGAFLPSHFSGGAIMPPPRPDDTTLLVRLDLGYCYGTTLSFIVKDNIPKTGKYAIRVMYKSWLPKDLVAPQLRQLPALWKESPPILSDPVWITIVR